jgi:hypothetical protein
MACAEGCDHCASTGLPLSSILTDLLLPLFECPIKTSEAPPQTDEAC